MPELSPLDAQGADAQGFAQAQTPQNSENRSVRWTTAQRQAIEHGGGDLLVSAAAGSGKTAVLAERCARLVSEEVEGGCGVEGLLVLTFTEAAANEMKERIAKAIRARLTDSTPRTPERTRWLRRQAAMVDRATISTLHAFCARVLRHHFSEAAIDPAFELMDEEEARLIRDEALDEVLTKFHALPKDNDHGFANFFEAYAQGSDATCREVILRVFHMLASSADPAAYVATSRRTYSPAGIPDTLERFLRQNVAEELRLLLLTAERACADVRARLGHCPMLGRLTEVLELLRWAQHELLTHGGAAVVPIREALTNHPWSKPIKSMEEVRDFKDLKERTWERVKDKTRKFCAKELSIDVTRLASDLATLGPSLEALLALVEAFQQSYADAKRARNRLDFSDLERLTLDLLTKPNSAACAELRQRYSHVLVDEFQDINPLQEALLKAVSSPERFDGKGNLFVVGDVKQAIYGFRLAQPELFLERERAARSDSGTGKHIALPHNFRSQPPLLAAMNGIFEKLLTPHVAGIDYQNGHALQPPPPPPIENQKSKIENPPPPPLSGTPIELHLVAMDAPSDDEPGEPEDDKKEPAENLSAVEEEARMVAARIKSLIADGHSITAKDGTTKPLEYRDIAILMRTMKNKAAIFSRALAEANIPVHAEMSTGYFDATEVRETLALLQVMDNPQQDIPLATVLLGPYGRFSHDDLAVLRLTFDRKAVSFAEAARRYPLFGETVRSGVGDGGREVPPFDAALAQRLRMVFEKIERWRGFLRTRPLHEGLAAIYEESKIFPYLAGLHAEGSAQRIANLQALHQRALKFSSFSKQGLHRFLRFIEKLRDQDGDLGEAPVMSEAWNVVRILSVHKSKGLEFPVVIVAGLGSSAGRPEGGGVVLHRDWGIGLQVVDVERNLATASAASAAITAAAKRSARAEELRLLYVAMTRARDHLLLTGQIKTTDALHKWRDRSPTHTADGLPEDELLAGKVYLEWLVPALACGRLTVQWDEHPVDHPEVVVHLHGTTGAGRAATPAAITENALRHALLAGKPLPPNTAVDAPDEAVARMIERVTGVYAQEDLSKTPAVRTVSELKRLGEEDDDAIPILPKIMIGTPRSATDGAPDALRRGIATHRLMELLDFSQCTDPPAVAAQVAALIHRGTLPPEEAAHADIPGITWLLTETDVGKRILAAPSRGTLVRREIPFTWVAPINPNDPTHNPADWPTIRGTLDLLLVNPHTHTAEIIDYKTDSPFTWQSHLPEYERQMAYYLRAASEILGFPLERATLAFLSPKQLREVRG